MNDGKILIMGVGGCGSGFLWGLLGDCGLKTLGINEWIRHSGIRQALKQGTQSQVEYPKVIKHLGGFLTNLNLHIEQHNWKVEHIFFAVGSLQLQMRTFRTRHQHGPFDYDNYLDIYKSKLGMGMIQVIEGGHPFTFIKCPTSLSNPEYCYNKLKVVLPEVSYNKFAKIHKARVDHSRLKKMLESMEKEND